MAQIINTKGFRGGVIAILAVAVIASGVVFALRYAAPEPAPLDEETPLTEPESQEAVPADGEAVAPNDTTINNNPATSQDAPKTNTVVIEDYAYQPSSITVKQGTTVTWTNRDAIPHTVTSESGDVLDSGLLSQGESYSYTFNKTGAFHYYCEPHPYMKGVVKVVE